ncbi:helix-turn-helix domain-containing protein [Actinophytocola sediminis]
MPRKSPNAKTKGLGAQLRALRKQAGVNIETAAAALGKSKQIVSRLETGHRSISPDEVAGLLALYRVVGPRREQLLAQARTLDDPGWWELPMPGMTRDSATLADYEEAAVRITSWAPLLPPGLLQTEDYARAYMREDGIPADQIEGRITGRLRRQARLRRADVEYLALIGEPALHGTGAVYREQLDALAEAAGRPNIAIRVVPGDAIPLHARLGGWLVAEPATGTTVVHVEMLRGGVFLDEDALTGPYLQTVIRLDSLARDESDSLRTIVQQRDRMEI